PGHEYLSVLIPGRTGRKPELDARHVLQRVCRNHQTRLLVHLAYRRRLGLLARFDVAAEADPLARAEARLLQPEQHLRPVGEVSPDQAQAGLRYHPHSLLGSSHASPHVMAMSRSSTAPLLTRSPSWSCSLVTHAR